MDIWTTIKSPVQSLEDEITREHDISVHIKREDLNHSEIIGNKLRKLKYNLIEAKQQRASALLSFGGAYSNHILALSAAGRIFNIPTIGIIRGEELLKAPLNPVLQQAKLNGMDLHFVSRESYKRRAQANYLVSLQERFGDCYIMPEGGSNQLGVQGAAEIVEDIGSDYDAIACACGTGGTLAGIIKGVCTQGFLSSKVIGFSVLKGGGFLRNDIENMLPEDISTRVSWHVNTDYHLGGYARSNTTLIDFLQWFKATHQIELDTIYTGKMVYGIYDLIQSGFFKKGSRLLLIHTGGTQTAKLMMGNDATI